MPADTSPMHTAEVSPAAAAQSDRWIRVGRSNDPDPVRAAHEVVQAAGATDPATKLLVVFADHEYAMQTLVNEIIAASATDQLIGCTTAGEIAADGASDAGVVLVTFGGTGFSVATTAAEEIGEKMRDAGQLAADAVFGLRERFEHTVLMVLTDTFAGDQQEILRGIYHRLGSEIPVVGGCAGDNLKMVQTFQFHGGQVLTDAVVAAAITSDAPFGIGAQHGWRTVGEPMTVTSSSGTVINELDSRPALDVYLERFDLPHSITDDSVEFRRFAMRHPLALARRSGEPLVRFLRGACPKSGGLLALAAVPEGANVWLMRGDDASVLAATHAACDEAFAAIDGAPTGVLVFDCVTRRDMLGDVGIQRELDVINARSGGAPVAGLFTYGEIARTRGINGFHHETLVVLAVG